MRQATAILTIAALALTSAGCDMGNTTSTDQCMRNELFQQCLTNAPAGPTSTHYNDWSEVVSACGSQAYYMSQRKRQFITEECHP